MYRKLLVPLDGSDFSEHALPLALAVAERTEGEIQLASAIPTLPPVVPSGEGDGPVRGWFEEERSRATEYLQGIRGRLEAAGATVPLHVKVLAGGPVRSLDERIRQTNVDLVVMTTHGRGPFERMWLGSVADGLVRTAPCPILLWRPGEDAPKPQERPAVNRVLVPLDGSDSAESILPEAAGLARAFGASLSLVAVVPGTFPLGSTYIPHAAEETRRRDENHAWFQTYLDDLAGKIRAEGLDVDSATIFGDDVAGTIMEFRDETEADLVAMSTRGRGGVARLVLGSVADKLIRAGRVPVLVHRQSEEEED